MIMCRYADINSFNKLPLKTGVKLIYKCLFEIEKQKAWDMWVAMYPKMKKDNYLPFEKFFNYSVDDIEPKEHKNTIDLLNVANDIQGKISTGKFKEVKM
jgi:hypothetical protein